MQRASHESRSLTRAARCAIRAGVAALSRSVDLDPDLCFRWSIAPTRLTHRSFRFRHPIGMAAYCTTCGKRVLDVDRSRRSVALVHLATCCRGGGCPPSSRATTTRRLAGRPVLRSFLWQRLCGAASRAHRWTHLRDDRRRRRVEPAGHDGTGSRRGRPPATSRETRSTRRTRRLRHPRGERVASIVDGSLVLVEAIEISRRWSSQRVRSTRSDPRHVERPCEGAVQRVDRGRGDPFGRSGQRVWRGLRRARTRGRVLSPGG